MLNQFIYLFENPTKLEVYWDVIKYSARLDSTESRVHVLRFHVFFFFFCAWTVKLHDFVVQGTKNIVHALFTNYSYTVHGSHDTIHIFKNYFATMFSVSVTISSIQTDSKHAFGLRFEENILRFV